MTKAAEFLQMSIPDLGSAQAARQHLVIKLGVAPGPRHRPHVDNAFYSVRLQKLDEGFQCARRVSDREND
jgi:hypothetical protein